MRDPGPPVRYEHVTSIDIDPYLTSIGIEHHFEDRDGQHASWMTHPDGSWSKATGRKGESAQVHQGWATPPLGHPDLWDILEQIRAD